MTAFGTSETEYASFDGGVRLGSRRRRPDRYRFFDELAAGAPVIPRGAGLSYAAASFGAGATVVEHQLLNRVLGFDDRRKVVEVEAGISLGDLHAFLSGRGLYLPVQPGHPSITVGGCVAADSHGKGHARWGTFSSQVVGLTLFHPRHGILELTRGDALLELTCGGYGLTGNILTVELQAESLGPRSFETAVLPVESLAELPRALASAERDWDFVYSWHDLLRFGHGFGRGYLQVARVSENGSSEDAKARASALAAETRGRFRYPLFGGATARAVNAIHSHRLERRAAVAPARVSPFTFQFPISGLEVYFHLFGRRGFLEHQVLLPPSAFGAWAERLESRLRAQPVSVTLASGKLFGGESRRLRFSGEGICFALDAQRDRASLEFLSFLDDLALEVGGKPNVIKDSRLPRRIVDASYPEADTFRAELRELDPQRQYRSELSDRLGL